MWFTFLWFARRSWQIGKNSSNIVLEWISDLLCYLLFSWVRALPAHGQKLFLSATPLLLWAGMFLAKKEAIGYRGLPDRKSSLGQFRQGDLSSRPFLISLFPLSLGSPMELSPTAFLVSLGDAVCDGSVFDGSQCTLLMLSQYSRRLSTTQLLADSPRVGWGGELEIRNWELMVWGSSLGKAIAVCVSKARQISNPS